MGRRRKTSPAEDLMELVAKVPWWAGVALALLSYVLLRPIAAQPLPVPAAGQRPVAMVMPSMIKAAAMVGQYVLPLACLAGAAASAFRRRQRAKLMTDAAERPAAGATDGLRWQEFELLVGEALRRKGYTVVESGGGGPDGGIDLVLSRPGRNGSEKTLVQCKHWRAYKVGVDVVRELYGVMAAKGAAAGIVVTSGSYTAEARAFAQGRNVELVDGPALQTMIREAKETVGARPARHQRSAEDRQVRAEPALSATPDKAPCCPACGKPMVRRVAKRGERAGREFWGCTGYPACKGVRQLSET